MIPPRSGKSRITVKTMEFRTGLLFISEIFAKSTVALNNPPKAQSRTVSPNNVRKMIFSR